MQTIRYTVVAVLSFLALIGLALSQVRGFYHPRDYEQMPRPRFYHPRDYEEPGPKFFHPADYNDERLPYPPQPYGLPPRRIGYGRPEEDQRYYAAPYRGPLGRRPYMLHDDDEWFFSKSRSSTPSRSGSKPSLFSRFRRPSKPTPSKRPSFFSRFRKPSPKPSPSTPTRRPSLFSRFRRPSKPTPTPTRRPSFLSRFRKPSPKPSPSAPTRRPSFFSRFRKPSPKPSPSTPTPTRRPSFLSRFRKPQPKPSPSTPTPTRRPSFLSRFRKPQPKPSPAPGKPEPKRRRWFPWQRRESRQPTPRPSPTRPTPTPRPSPTRQPTPQEQPRRRGFLSRLFGRKDQPGQQPSQQPTRQPTQQQPTRQPARQPTPQPTRQPTRPTSGSLRQMYSGTQGQREKVLLNAVRQSGMSGTEANQFMSQMAHESDRFKAMHEYASGRAYEGRKDLGNTQQGDGVRFKGRGYIQLTGRDNYRRYGQKIGVDLVNNPELAAKPEVAAKVALAYWQDRVKPRVSDFTNTRKVTKLINGGSRGLADRERAFAFYQNQQ